MNPTAPRKAGRGSPWPWARGFAGDEQPLFLHSLRLENQLFDFMIVRFLVALAIIAGAYFARDVVGIEHLDVPGLCLLALLLGFTNMVTFSLVRPFRGKPEQAARARRFLSSVLHVSIVSDFLFLTVALWMVGGAQSPFQAFFIFHVIIASVLFSSRVAFIHAAIGYILLSGLIVGTWREWIPSHAPEGAVPTALPLDGRFVFTVLTVQGLLFILTAFLGTHLMWFLRDGQRQALRANQELAHVSRQRRDFLRVALHNLRAPIAAVGMHLNNLKAGYGGALSDAQKDWVSRSQRRVMELTTFLNDLEYLVMLESGPLQDHSEIFDLGPLIEEAIASYQEAATARRHRLDLKIAPSIPPIKGFRRLIREAAVNLISNAIKYTPEGGAIQVRVMRRNDRVRLEVQDTGIGIAPEDQKDLFREFVRVYKKSPELPEVSGSGLGLFIVRQIVEAHGGHADLVSAPGQGSTFGLEFPAAPLHPPAE